jgi:hypothetical protein
VSALDRLRADLARAERALSDLELSDDLCHVTGAWARAHGLVLSIRRELAEVAQ